MRVLARTELVMLQRAQHVCRRVVDFVFDAVSKQLGRPRSLRMLSGQRLVAYVVCLSIAVMFCVDVSELVDDFFLNCITNNKYHIVAVAWRLIVKHVVRACMWSDVVCCIRVAESAFAFGKRFFSGFELEGFRSLVFFEFLVFLEQFLASDLQCSDSFAHCCL